MEGGAELKLTQGSELKKEAQVNLVEKKFLGPDENVNKTLEGSAGLEISNGVPTTRQTDIITLKSNNKLTNSAVDNFATTTDEVVFDYEIENDKTNNVLSGETDDLLSNSSKTDFKQTSSKEPATSQEELDDTRSYSTGSVVSLGSEEVEENCDDEGQLDDAGGDKNKTQLCANSSHTPKSAATDDPDLAQQIEQSKRFFKNFSRMFHENNVEDNSDTVTDTIPTTLPDCKVNDSPKAISLISCSDDSFAPIRPSGKKRPNMFEDTDSEAEQDPNEADELECEDEYKIHFKRNHERKAKRIQLDDKKIPSPKESKSRAFVSDFDQMMQKKRKEKSKSHVGRRLDFITKNDDLIEQLIDQMEYAAYEDRCLNEQGQPATKKVAMLKFVASQLIKKDLQPLFLEHNILSTLAEWLSPLPSKCLPCLPIREGIIHILEDLPTISSALLKESGIGKALMFLCKHPEETKKNRESCRRLIAQWARPIYNLTCDYRAMSKAERQERDIELSTRYRIQVADKSSNLKGRRQPARVLEQALRGEESKRVLLPGEHGWVPRARVPQPSTKDYVHRPQSQLSCQLTNLRLKPQPNRYEALAKKHQIAKRSKDAQHSKVGLSIFGSKV